MEELIDGSELTDGGESTDGGQLTDGGQVVAAPGRGDHVAVGVELDVAL